MGKMNLFVAAGIMLSIIISCGESGPTGSNEDSKLDAPDTVSSERIYGEWEGGIPYKNPDEDNYESDTFYVTHFGIYKKKAAIGDSIGYIKWDNRNEYCKGTLVALDQAPDDSLYYGNTNVSPQKGKQCYSRDHSGYVKYVKEENREWLLFGGERALGIGRLYPKD